MAYLDKILEAYVRQGIRTPAEAEKARAEFMKQYHEKKTMKAPGKSVSTQSYQQRDYSGKQQEMMDLFIRMNGGEDNA
jgi:DNA replication protein DnaD